MMKTKGWSKVLKFTYIQMIKSKPFIVSCIIIFAVFFLMMAGVNFLPKILAEPDKTIEITDENGNVVGVEKAFFEIEKVYIYDNSGLGIDFSSLNEYRVEYEGITAEQVYDISQMITASLESEVMAVVEKTEYGYEINMARPTNTDLITSTDCYELLELFRAVVSNANLVSLGISEEDLGAANATIYTKVTVEGETDGELAEYIGSLVIMISSLLLFVVIVTYSQSTAQSIAMEKTSRVMELLLTSINPLAVIIGKVLAMALVAITSIFGMGGLMALMFSAFAPMGTLGEVFGMVDTDSAVISEISVELTGIFERVGLAEILMVVLVFALGFLFFSMIAGLIGATISRAEDLQTALQPLTIISVLGFYLSYFAPLTGLNGGGGNFLVKLSYYLPISSPYALPGAILSGDISKGEAVIAIAFLAVCLVLFAMFVAKVYEHIILYSGNRLKIKDMIKMARNNK